MFYYIRVRRYSASVGACKDKGFWDGMKPKTTNKKPSLSIYQPPCLHLLLSVYTEVGWVPANTLCGYFLKNMNENRKCFLGQEGRKELVRDTHYITKTFYVRDFSRLCVASVRHTNPHQYYHQKKAVTLTPSLTPSLTPHSPPHSPPSLPPSLTPSLTP